MLMTKRRPATVGEILTEEFMVPMGLTQGALAEAMGVQRKHVNELCNNRRNVTAATALILARVFGNGPDFWLNVQRRSELWEAMHDPKEQARVRRSQTARKRCVMSPPEVEGSRSRSLPESTMSPIATYCDLMEEVKLRLAVVRRFTCGEITLDREDFDAETLCVHLRKILEAIAFGSLVAHRDVYETVHRDTDSRWRAKEILERIGKVHANFYPKPVTPSRIDGNLSMEKVETGFLTQADFATLYDKCSDMLHLWNPFRGDPRTMDFGHSLNKWCDLIENLLRHHVVWIRTGGEPHVCVDGVPESGEGWLIYLSHPDDSKTHSFLFAPTADAGAVG